jgi:ribosomal protein S18 acetylase RimI-like enzyme
MEMHNYRQGTHEDITALCRLGIASWSQFQTMLTADHWEALIKNVSNESTYSALLDKSFCFVCTENDQLAGMAFLMYSGTAYDVYQADWCSIRFVSVHPAYTGKGIGKKLTQLCIDKARERGEKTIALHTSEIMPNARHIYESMGFAIQKEISPRFGKRYWLYTMDI